MRAFAFAILLLGAFFLPYPAFVIASVAYIFFFSGYELLVIAFLVDTLMGIAHTDVLYTITIGVLLLCSLYLKPHISWYTRDTV